MKKVWKKGRRASKSRKCSKGAQKRRRSKRKLTASKLGPHNSRPYAVRKTMERGTQSRYTGEIYNNNKGEIIARKRREYKQHLRAWRPL